MCMLNNSMVSKLNKDCSCCQSNTMHNETFMIEHPPEILTLVINRFDQALVGGKNKVPIQIDREIQIASSKYNLIGSIHHHGNTITSVHYTSNIFYPESAYTCNDSQVIPLSCSGPSDSVYMVFYAHSGWPAQ